VLLFISTHSEQWRGDLFAGQEGSERNPKPVAIEKFTWICNEADHCLRFFSILLAGNFAFILNEAAVVLLTCGWLVQHKESFNQLQSSLQW
ncbi:hypothetical protein PAXRUDRAFT_159406, partial [Paxillus rubicundulus Ve08.2h10]